MVGISKFCIHPDTMYRSIERVGGTKDLNLKKIRALKPDLIIGNKEENEKEQIEELQKEFPVWMSDIYNFDDAFVMMKQLGHLLGKAQAALDMTQEMETALKPLKDLFKGQSVAYFIWNAPYMLAAQNTYINYVLNYIGFKNELDTAQRYPVLDEDQLKKMKPEFCFLSSEPYPFKKKHVEQISQLLPASKVVLVDGEMFSWYGSRLLKLPAYINGLAERLKLM